jgi:hypothetical protein
LENTHEVVILSPPKPVNELEETPKMTSGKKGNLKRGRTRKKQISEYTPQSSRIEIRIDQQMQTPETTPQTFKVKIKLTQEKQLPRPTNVINMNKRNLFEENSMPINKYEEVLPPI